MVFFGSHNRRVCGFHYLHGQNPTYLPQVKVEAQTSIISSIARTTLIQTFVNPATHAIPQLYYTFPLFDGVSIVDFTCTVGDRVIKGIVKEKAQAKATFDHAVAQGQTAGLLEQAVDTAGDVFKTSVGNVPGGAQIKVEISCLGELKHDAQNNGLRLTIPTTIAPRYGSYPGSLQTPHAASATTHGGMKITVDAQVSSGSRITSIQSPSHQIAVTTGRTSTASDQEELSFEKASATLSLGTAELDKDFVLQMTATEIGNPVAILEEHPSMPDQKAIMATLVPKFELAPEKPEVVFVCDRSGSMSDKIIDLKKALQLFVKSLAVGIKFNICSFGSCHSFLWDRSRTYDSASMAEAMQHIESFSANYGGTEMYAPIEQTITRRYQDMNLEVFLLTDGEIWDQDRLVHLINEGVAASDGAIRFFTLGIGPSVSHSLIERVARAGNGFAQAIGNSEEMGSKVVRMLKGAMFPHIKDYTMEVKYEADQDEDFEVIETLEESLVVPIPETKETQEETASPKKPISLFDPSVNDAAPVVVTSGINTGAVEKFSAIPPISVPKLLQAPHLIPPLFPFTRSTIYLLLSSETRTPKSVVLRGTSRQGPLKLEIPVSPPRRERQKHPSAGRQEGRRRARGGPRLDLSRQGF
ncbi:WAS/WASL-interacting protein family member 1 [Apiospora hydei]|uniref:WAS/WASL-interacting protein family member 1 n=1 Tax=Apiospora hydei TaxID=1337664 RepID=A0ABR1WA51_9PEZI